jgi:NAD(P)H-hydrate repair Nnr-like enzyme with NAD(P)H-hydrate epimerase domain
MNFVKITGMLWHACHSILCGAGNNAADSFTKLFDLIFDKITP